jgi:hypothetical protein
MPAQATIQLPFLAANPQETNRLPIDEETRALLLRQSLKS